MKAAIWHFWWLSPPVGHQNLGFQTFGKQGFDSLTWRPLQDFLRSMRVSLRLGMCLSMHQGIYVCPCPLKGGFLPMLFSSVGQHFLGSGVYDKGLQSSWNWSRMNSQMCPPKKLHPFFLPLFFVGGHHRIFALSGLCLYGTRMESWWGDLCLLAQEEFYHVVADLKSHMLEGGQDVTFWAVKRLFFRA